MSKKEGMKDIFAELYNKVLSFFATPPVEEDTKSVAINRLKTVLMQDRVGFSERALQMMKDEMITCISKYMEIDEESFELQIDAEEDKTVLNLSIPVIRPKTDDEIDEAIKKQAEKTQVKAEEIVLELEEIIEERAQALAEEISKEVVDVVVSEVKSEIGIEESTEEAVEESPSEVEAQTGETKDATEENSEEKQEDISENKPKK